MADSLGLTIGNCTTLLLAKQMGRPAPPWVLKKLRDEDQLATGGLAPPEPSPDTRKPPSGYQPSGGLSLPTRGFQQAPTEREESVDDIPIERSKREPVGFCCQYYG